MNDHELDQGLASSNPIHRAATSELIPPAVGDAMLREITSARPQSTFGLFGSRMSNGGLARVGFVGVLAVMVMAVAGLNLTSLDTGDGRLAPTDGAATGPSPQADGINGDGDGRKLGDGGTNRPTVSVAPTDAGKQGRPPTGTSKGVAVGQAATDSVIDDDPAGQSSPGAQDNGIVGPSDDAAVDQPGADTGGTGTAGPAGTAPCTATGNTLTRAVTLYERDCSQPRADCDPVDGQWVCSSQTLGSGASGWPATSGGAGSDDGGFDPSNDLISLHYDHAPDLDDGHATVAAKVVVDTLGVTPWVVGGAYGENGPDYQARSESVMDAAWGSAWVNAHRDRSGAVAATADRWQVALESGGDIWVAEGGQSDLTADVVRELKRRLPNLVVRSRIHVVQHSQWNEDQTSDADLVYIKNNSDYIRLQDGNATNATANLNQRTGGFADRARSSRWGVAWDAAFDYLDPARRLDFSDTVELLHIIGVTKDEVATPADFADRFFG